MIFFRVSEKESQIFNKFNEEFDLAQYKKWEFDGLDFSFIATNKLDEYIYIEGRNRILFISGDFVDEVTSLKRKISDFIENSIDAVIFYLESLEGQFSGFVYDKKNKELVSVSDRLGFGLVYYRTDNIKAISNIASSIVVSGDLTEINYRAISSFLEKGHLNGNDTYFHSIVCCGNTENVVFDSESNYRLRLKKNILEDIPSREFCVEKVNDILSNNIEKIIDKYKDKGFICTLSGGQDSRLLLSLFKKYRDDITTLTFGHKRCRDFKIVNLLQRKFSFKSNKYDISKENILKSRRKYVLMTDGMKDILHLHCNNHGVQNKVNLNGFLGDVVIGGSYITLHDDELDKFFNRGRRFINLGRVAYSIDNKQISPFVSLELINLLYGNSKELRKDNILYRDLIDKCHSSYFNDIPTQKYYLLYNEKINPISELVFRKMRRAYELIFRLSRSDNYTDYNLWTKRKSNQVEYHNHMLSINDNLVDFVSDDVIRNYRLITLSIMLNYLYE